MLALCPEYPKRDQNPKFTPLSETTSIPICFIWEPPPKKLKTNNLIFRAQIIGLNPVFKYEKKKHIFSLKLTGIFVLEIRVINVISKN